jgi:RimJ/RimL family protein N-acetyltransferase
VTVPELSTSRLLLRGWRDEDLAPFAALNADPEVMRYLPSVQTREESDAAVRNLILPSFEQHGFGLWAAERKDRAEFIGFVGLSVAGFDVGFTPAVEVGWRLARAQWGHGFATEAATASLEFGFGTAGLDEIVSFTSPLNRRSRAVMERIGLLHDPASDFDHPRLPAGHRLSRHVLYRISRADWELQRAGNR